VVFNAPDIAEQILRCEDPRVQKRLALNIPNFDTELWYDRYAKKAMWKGLCAKFSQDASVRRALLETAGTILVECSPKDVRWGIGWPMTSPNCLDASKWRGKNWLGKQLTKLREKFMSDPKYTREVRRYVQMPDRRRTSWKIVEKCLSTVSGRLRFVSYRSAGCVDQLYQYIVYSWFT